jgi:hypothetical protein
VTLDDLKQLIANRLVFLEQQRALAAGIGDVGHVNSLDAEIVDTELTADQLDTL